MEDSGKKVRNTANITMILVLTFMSIVFVSLGSGIIGVSIKQYNREGTYLKATITNKDIDRVTTTRRSDGKKTTSTSTYYYIFMELETGENIKIDARNSYDYKNKYNIGSSIEVYKSGDQYSWSKEQWLRDNIIFMLMGSAFIIGMSFIYITFAGQMYKVKGKIAAALVIIINIVVVVSINIK